MLKSYNKLFRKLFRCRKKIATYEMRTLDYQIVGLINEIRQNKKIETLGVDKKLCNISFYYDQEKINKKQKYSNRNIEIFNKVAYGNAIIILNKLLDIDAFKKAIKNKNHQHIGISTQITDKNAIAVRIIFLE